MEFKQDQERSIDLAECVIASTEVVHSDFNTCFNALTTLLAQTLSTHLDSEPYTSDAQLLSHSRSSIASYVTEHEHAHEHEHEHEHEHCATSTGGTSAIGLRSPRFALSHSSDCMQPLPLLPAHVIDEGLGLCAGVGQMSLHSARTKLVTALSRMKSGSTDSLLVDSSRSSSASRAETNQEILYSAIDSSLRAFKVQYFGLFVLPPCFWF